MVTGGTTTTTDYIGSHVYQNGVLYQMAHGEGRIIPQGSEYQYQWSLTDHLGNLRVSLVAGADGKAQLVQAQDYDPWGWQLQGLGTLPALTDHYKYNGKEEQAEVDLYDYGARFYGATEGRWGVVDPLAEATYSHSPFGYVGGNPVRNTDPTGMLSSEEYRKWAREADAFNSRAERQGVGAYSALAEGGPGPGDKNKKAASQQQSTKPKQAGQSQAQQAEAGAGAILVGSSALSKVGTAIEVVTEATLEGIATGVGATLAVALLPFTVTGDESTTQNPDGPVRIALGVDEYLTHFSNSPNVNALSYKTGWANVSDGWDIVSASIFKMGLDPNVTFHFNLSTPRGRLDSPVNQKVWADQMTTMEFQLVMKFFPHKTTFY